MRYLIAISIFISGCWALQDPITKQEVDPITGRCKAGKQEYKRLLEWHYHLIKPENYFKLKNARAVLNSIRDDMRNFFLKGEGLEWNKDILNDIKKLNPEVALPRFKHYGFSKKIASEEEKKKVQEAFAAIRMADLDPPFDYESAGKTLKQKSWLTFISFSEKCAGAIAYSRDLNTYNKEQMEKAFRKHIPIYMEGFQEAYKNTRILKLEDYKALKNNKDLIMKKHPFSVIKGQKSDGVKLHELQLNNFKYQTILIDNNGAGDCGFYSFKLERDSVVKNLSNDTHLEGLVIQELLHERPEEFGNNFSTSIKDHNLKKEMEEFIKERHEEDVKEGYSETIDLSNLEAKKDNTKFSIPHKFNAFKEKWGPQYLKAVYEEACVWLTQPSEYTTHLNIIDAISQKYLISPFFFITGHHKLDENALMPHDYESALEKVEGFITGRPVFILYQNQAHFQTFVPFYED